MVDTILVPVDLPDPEPLSQTLVSDLASLNVVVVGHYEVPEQTPRQMAREQFDEDAQAAVEEVADRFREVGASVRTRLVFGKDRNAAVDRVAAEEECIAELDPAPTESVERILVPVPDVAEFSRLPTFVRILCEDTTKEITLFHVVEGEEDRTEGQRILDETREGMMEAGFDPDLLDTRLMTEADGHDTAILNVAAEYDAVVMYQPSSRLGDRIFGNLSTRIAKETRDPVIVVQRDY
jgi:nucleotide-binding universal stress UspA family protein